MNDLAIVIPAFNEVDNIEATLHSLDGLGTVIIVDDGSTDGTREKCRDLNCTLVEHERNKGYNQALITGIQLAEQQGFKFAVTFDADGQHSPSMLKEIHNLLKNGNDIVVGKRKKLQRFSEMVFSRVTSLLWKISDPLCGFKGYNLESIQGINDLGSYDSVGTEIMMMALRSKKHFSIAQIDIPLIERNGESTFGNGLKPNLIILKALLLGFFTKKM